MPAEATLGEVAGAAIAGGVDRLLRNEAILLECYRREGHQPESGRQEGDRREGGTDTVAAAVHQMRVATRRLRSDLRTFEPALDRSWARELREELSWIAGVLGAARDADVLSERLSGRTRKLARRQAQGAAEATAALAEQREHAHAALREALGDERHEALRNRLRAAAASPALRSSGKAVRPAGEALPAVVGRAWRRLEKEVASLAQAPSDAELHRVRISAKRCRYAAEACAATLGKPTARLARACKELQTVLGELNDAVVAGQWLHTWAEQAPTPAGAAAARELAAAERAAAQDARARWWKAWKRTVAQAPAADPPPSR